MSTATAADEMVIHVAEACICRRRRSSLSYEYYYSAAELLLDRRPCAEYINAHTCRTVGTKSPRGIYHSSYNLVLTLELVCMNYEAAVVTSIC